MLEETAECAYNKPALPLVRADTLFTELYRAHDCAGLSNAEPSQKIGLPLNNRLPLKDRSIWAVDRQYLGPWPLRYILAQGSAVTFYTYP